MKYANWCMEILLITLNDLKWKKTNDPCGWNWCNWSMKRYLWTKKMALFPLANVDCYVLFLCLSANTYKNVTGFLLDASKCQRRGKPPCQSTISISNWCNSSIRPLKALWEAQPVSLFLYQAGIFLNFCHQIVAFAAQVLGDALLSLHSAFPQRRKRECMRMRHIAGWSLLRGR